MGYEDRKQYIKENYEKFKATNTIWGDYKFNQRKSVGCMNKIIKFYYLSHKSIFDTLTADDFVDYYFKNFKSKKEFCDMGKRFIEACKKNDVKINMKDAYVFSVVRVLDNTWDGLQWELKAKSFLQEIYNDLDIKLSTENDINFCIDLELYKDKEIKEVFQVKPISFRYGYKSRRPYCVKAYNENFEKHQLFYDKTNIKVHYIFYNPMTSEMDITDYDNIL